MGPAAMRRSIAHAMHEMSSQHRVRRKGAGTCAISTSWADWSTIRFDCIPTRYHLLATVCVCVCVVEIEFQVWSNGRLTLLKKRESSTHCAHSTHGMRWNGLWSAMAMANVTMCRLGQGQTHGAIYPPAEKKPPENNTPPWPVEEKECLRSSCLPRYLASLWFDRAVAAQLAR